MADDLDALVSDNEFGTTATITFNNVSYAAMVSPYTRSKEMVDAGYFQVIDAEVVVKRSLFGTEPVENDTVTIDGSDYRIVRLVKDSVALTLICQKLK